VPSLSGSAADDRHFTLDRETGRIRFGDGRAWLAVPIGTALAGFLAAFLRQRRA
jgi:hypothetical protein